MGYIRLVAAFVKVTAENAARSECRPVKAVAYEFGGKQDLNAPEPVAFFALYVRKLVRQRVYRLFITLDRVFGGKICSV